MQTFKKGPDYIDPMWLARASGRACYNLDFNTQSPAEIFALFAPRRCRRRSCAGRGQQGLARRRRRRRLAIRARRWPSCCARPSYSSSTPGHDARRSRRCCSATRRSTRRRQIAGVILNKVGTARQETKLRQALERYTDMRVIGAIGRGEGLQGRRAPPRPDDAGRKPGARADDRRARNAVERGVDLDALLHDHRRRSGANTVGAAVLRAPAPDVRIAVARDAAFGFYYADDLEALARAGAELVFFDALSRHPVAGLRRPLHRRRLSRNQRRARWLPTPPCARTYETPCGRGFQLMPSAAG